MLRRLNNNNKEDYYNNEELHGLFIKALNTLNYQRFFILTIFINFTKLFIA